MNPIQGNYATYQTSNMAKPAATAVSTTAEPGPLAALADSAVSVVSDVAKALYDGTLSEAHEIEAAAVSAYDMVRNGVNAVGAYAAQTEDAIGRAVNATSGAVGGAVDAVEEAASSAVSGVDDAAGALAAYVAEGAKAVGQFLNITG